MQQRRKKKSRGCTCGVIVTIIVVIMCLIIIGIFSDHSGGQNADDLNATATAQAQLTANDAAATADAATTTALAQAVQDTPVATAQPTDTPTPQAQPTRQATPKPTPRPTQPAPTCQAVNNNPWCYNFVQGNLIYSPNSAFCDYFACVSTFWKDTNGYVAECGNGEYTHSGGVSGACSRDGGVSRALYSH